MPATLRQIKNGLRLKLGEVTDGTWGEVQYGDQAEYFDEYAFAINRAQDDLARDIYDPETYPFTKTTVDLPVVTSARFYTLPADFLAMEEVRHFRYNRSRPVLPGAIKNTRWEYDTASGGYYRHYEVKGRIDTYVASGVAMSASDTQVIDASGNFTSVRVQDVVYNLTDGSEARVTGFESGLITFDGLEGGMRNVFDRGDSYAIGTSEHTRWMLFVDPPVLNANAVLWNGVADPITAGKAGVVQEVYVTHATLPAGWTDSDVASYRIEKQNGNLASSAPPSVAGESGIRVGTQQVTGFQPFQIAENTSYRITCTDESGDPIAISNVRLEIESSDRIILNYAKRPRSLLREDSICEFPNECLSALYQGAANILLEKISDNGTVPKILLDKYNYEVQKIENFFASKDESGPYEIAVSSDGEYIDYLHQSQSDQHIWTREVY